MFKFKLSHFSLSLTFYIFFNGLPTFSQVKELESLRYSIYRFTQYDIGKTDSIAKNKANTARLKAELDLAWMNFILHKDSKNLEVLKRDAVNNKTSYSIGNHSYFFGELPKDISTRNKENNLYYSIGFYGIYDYALPNFVHVYIQPYSVNNKDLVIYYFNLNGSGTYYIKDIAANKIVFKSDAVTSNPPIIAFQPIDIDHYLLIEEMQNNGQRAMVIEVNRDGWKQIKAFKGKSFRNPLADYANKFDAGPRAFLRFAENNNITSIYGSGFLKKYEIHFDETSKTISYKQYRNNESEAPVMKAVWQNNSFTIDDYYIGEHLNDEPMPFPG